MDGPGLLLRDGTELDKTKKLQGSTGRGGEGVLNCGCCQGGAGLGKDGVIHGCCFPLSCLYSSKNFFPLSLITDQP